ncbi:PREDICTED: uncharacterized protein LOC108559348 [Nicrophorus vespilloides]|uniref:Uncharacterized protein LOC108559348 n=1 Tax=Nicrophorus vespilloides TaxID=110193 RepID=A0ABM1MBY3_NICVS|nr:PREDICTED: uncharacterized protein LOC108559348 [Nicrophorus vespilloides]
MSNTNYNEDYQPMNLSTNLDQRPSLVERKIQAKTTTEPTKYLVPPKNDKQVEASINHLTKLSMRPFGTQFQASEVLEWANPDVEKFGEVKDSKVDYFGDIKKKRKENFANEKRDLLLKHLRGDIKRFRYDDKEDKAELVNRCCYLEEELKKLKIQNKIQDDLLKQRMHRCIECLKKIS